MYQQDIRKRERERESEFVGCFNLKEVARDNGVLSVFSFQLEKMTRIKMEREDIPLMLMSVIFTQII